MVLVFLMQFQYHQETLYDIYVNIYMYPKQDIYFLTSYVFRLLPNLRRLKVLEGLEETEIYNSLRNKNKCFVFNVYIYIYIYIYIYV